MKSDKKIYQKKEDRYEGKYTGYKDKNSTSLSTIALEWLNSKKGNVDSVSYENYKIILNNHIIPYGKDIPITDFENDENLIKFIKYIQSSNFSDITVNNIKRIFRLILSYSAKNGYIEIFNLSLLKNTHQEKELKIIPLCIEKALKEYLLTNMTNRNFIILLAMFTGLKVGQLCTIKYGDIDVTTNTLYIRGVAKRVPIDNKDLKTKSKVIEIPYDEAKSIPLPDFLISIFMQLKKDSSSKFYIFSNDFTISDLRTIQEHLRKISIFLKLDKYLTMTDIRDNFIYKAIKANFNVKSLSDILGINIYEIYYKYLDYSEEIKRNDMNKLKINM